MQLAIIKKLTNQHLLPITYYFRVAALDVHGQLTRYKEVQNWCIQRDAFDERGSTDNLLLLV